MTPSLKISTTNTMTYSPYHRLNDTMIDDSSPSPTQSRGSSNNDESLNSNNSNNNHHYIQNYSKIALEDGNYQYLYHGVSMNIHTIYCYYYYTPSSQCNCTMNNNNNNNNNSCSHQRQHHFNHNYDYYMQQYKYTQSPTYSYSTTGNYHRNRDLDTKTSSDSKIAGNTNTMKSTYNGYDGYGVENTLISSSKTANNLIISKIASGSDGSSQSDISNLDLNVSSSSISMMSHLNLDDY